MKRILLISYNFYPELTGVGKYNGEMIDWLVKNGYDCSVLTAYPYYPFWKVQEPYMGIRYSYSTEDFRDEDSHGKLRIYRCPLFVPSKPTGFKRILLDVSFLITAFLRLVTLLPLKKYDLVMAVAPSFQVGLLGVLYKKLRGAKLLYHIQDLQIEAARDLKMIKSESILNALLKTEKKILDHADLVSSISEEMVRKVERKAGKRAFLFPNWTNTQQFFPIQNRDDLKKEFGFGISDKIVLYSGAIGEKQGLEAILFAADAYRTNEHLKFVICGSGPYKDKLIQNAKQKRLSNVHFFPLQPLQDFNRFLNMADIHLVIQKACAGDLVMPSKLGAILAVGGLTLITSNPGTSLHTLVKSNNIGHLVNAEDQNSLNEGIAKLLSEDYEHVRKNARHYAVDFLSADRVMSQFENIFSRLWMEDSTSDTSELRELQETVPSGVHEKAPVNV